MTRTRTPARRRLTSQEEERFWRKVHRAELAACWPWTAAKRQNGYGNFRAAGRNWYPHRLAWILTRNDGRDTPLDVLHVCDNPPCCNPDHLYAGTARDNARDCVERGRHARAGGEAGVKLTEADVRHIRQSDESGYALARRFGVSAPTISHVRTGHTWR